MLLRLASVLQQCCMTLMPTIFEGGLCMTRNEAREILAETWRFSRAGDLIAVSEVGLIEAVRATEASRSPNPSATYTYAEVHAPPSL